MSKTAGAWLLAAAASFGLIAALVNYFWPDTPVDYSRVALIVIVSTALLMALGLLLAILRRTGALGAVLTGLAFVDLLATMTAAVFLHAWIVLASMGVALVGWLVTAVRLASVKLPTTTSAARR